MTDKITEKALAEELGVDRDVLRKLRTGGTLTPEEDWWEQRGIGILISAGGQKKIRAALVVAELPLDEPGAVRDIRVRRVFEGNPRVLEGFPEAGESRVMIRLNRGPSPHYRVGMVIPGCRKLLQAELWEYDGPKPRRLGAF